MNEPRVESNIQTWLSEGQAALLAGDSYEARLRFRRVLDQDPDNVEALVGMAGTVRPYREKRDYLERVLALEPGNDEARTSLAYIVGKIAAGEVLAPRGVTVHDERGDSVTSAGAPTVTPETAAASTPLYCYSHPNRETGLRCTSCDRPICSDCVRPAPVGQLCPECARARRPTNYQVSFGTLAVVGSISFVASAVLSFLVLWLIAPLPFISFIVSFMLAPVVAEGLVRLFDRLTKAKRGRAIQLTVGIALGLGSVFWLWLVFPSFPALLLLLFIGILIATAMARLR